MEVPPGGPKLKSGLSQTGKGIRTKTLKLSVLGFLLHFPPFLPPPPPCLGTATIIKLIIMYFMRLQPVFIVPGFFFIYQNVVKVDRGSLTCVTTFSAGCSHEDKTCSDEHANWLI